MANTTSAQKALRNQERKYNKNQKHREAFRSARKAVVKAVQAGDAKAAASLLPKFYKEVDKAAKHNGFLHKNTAGRYKSRLTALVNSASE